MSIIGQILDIALKLDDDNPNKHVRARVFDSDRVEITGSPFTLLLAGSGMYSTDQVVMLDTPFMTVAYEVFDDALFAVKSVDEYFDGGDSFRIDRTFTRESLIGDLIASIETVELQANLDESNILSASIDANEVTATIEADEITGKVESNEFNASVE